MPLTVLTSAFCEQFAWPRDYRRRRSNDLDEIGIVLYTALLPYGLRGARGRTPAARRRAGLNRKGVEHQGFHRPTRILAEQSQGVQINQ
jgi:hypothetical protein